MVTKRTNPNFANDLLARMRAAASKEVACGYPKGVAQAYPDGQSVIDVAARHCFGLGVPVRDFMTLAKQFINGDQVIKDCMTEIAKAAHSKEPGVIEALQQAAGQRAADLIKEAIQTGDWTPNSEETIARKGSAQPLIDTRHMHNAATHVVREKAA